MKKHYLILLMCYVLFPFAVNAQDWKVLFSATGGFYEDAFELELFSTYPQGRIFYTTNGNRPTVEARQYTEPLVMDSCLFSTSDIYTIQITPDDLVFIPDSVQHCIVIRAAVFDENDSCISPVVTQSYFIKSLGCDTHGLPAVSLCADSLDLFDYERGIFVPGSHFDSLNPNWSGNYYQSGEEWERQINIEFYELDNRGINQRAGLRTHGGNGRRFQQKCVKVYAREEYGKKRFKHKFFETIPQDSFKHLVLKPFAASWNQSGVNDHICNQIASQLNLETLASRPVLLYLNGEYWGIYYIHERPDERYLEDHFDVNIDDVNIMSNWYNHVDHGTSENFIALHQWVTTADLTNPDDYAYFGSRIDIDNFIDYQIFEMFSENLDWPTNNMRCWQLGDGPWRWIFHDGDACLLWMTFSAFDNAVYEGDDIWPSSSRATLFLRKLLENEDFKDRFESRFIELLSSAFSYETTRPIYEDIKMRIESEVPLQSERFGFPSTMEAWIVDMERVEYFLRTRADQVLEPMHHLVDGIPENQVGGIVCYPNPFVDELCIAIDIEGFDAKEVAIYDLMGRMVYEQPCCLKEERNSLTLHLQLPSGMYVLKVGSHAQRIVRL